MKRSTDRILTTHAGSLPRPADLQELIKSQQIGQDYDRQALERRVEIAVADVVHQQAKIGVDIPSDGERAHRSRRQGRTVQEEIRT